MEFLMMDGKLLVNTHICSADKIILSYFKNLNNKGKGYWGSIEYLAKVLGMHTNKSNIMEALEKFSNKMRVNNG
jgi:phenylalanyl-tRNA synthetase beta subunit